MKSIILTGATGMIGTAIIEESLKNNYSIIAVVRRGSSRLSNITQNKNVRIIECNIDEYASADFNLKADVFMHLAWEKTSGTDRDDANIQLNNIQYTLDAIHLARRCGCSVFIGAGSQAEYGIQTVDLTPELPVNPESGYGIAKYTAGKLGALLCKQLGMRFNWLRILSIYGKNDAPHTLISYVINELKAGRSPDLTKCEQTWDYLNCADAARAFLAVAEKGRDGTFYPLGSGKGRKLSEYLEEIRSIVNPNTQLGFGKKEYYPHQPMYLVANIKELKKDTGWEPIVNWKESIQSYL